VLIFALPHQMELRYRHLFNSDIGKTKTAVRDAPAVKGKKQ